MFHSLVIKIVLLTPKIVWHPNPTKLSYCILPVLMTVLNVINKLKGNLTEEKENQENPKKATELL